MSKPGTRRRATAAPHNKPGQRVMAALRRLIASGELPDGERIAEIPTAERLGVSRMPVRTALRALAMEGLVVPLGARGFAARQPKPSALRGAVEVRGVLEGLAARQVAQHPEHAAIADRLAAIIAPCDALFTASMQADAVVGQYAVANSALHDAVVQSCNNDAIALALAQTNRLPLAAPDAFAFHPDHPERMQTLLRRAHDEHRAVIAAIAAGEADRAEALMRRHAQVSLAFEHELDPGQAATLPQG